MGGLKDVVREYLSRRTPDGYYVIPAKADVLHILGKLSDEIEYEFAGNIVFLKVRSRSLGEKLIRRLYRLRLLA